MRRQVRVGVYRTKKQKRVLITCFASRRNERRLGINEETAPAVPVAMGVRRGQDAESVRIKRRHGAMSAGEILEEELCLKAVALLSVVTGEEENEEEESDLLVAAALSKIDARVALLVREVGVALLCFYSGRRDMCVCCLRFARAFTFSKSDASPQLTICGVSIMTTADSAVCICY